MKARIELSDKSNFNIESPDIDELGFLHFFLACLSMSKLTDTATYNQLLGLHDGMRFAERKREHLSKKRIGGGRAMSDTHSAYIIGEGFSAFVDGIPDKCQHDMDGEALLFTDGYHYLKQSECPD